MERLSCIFAATWSRSLGEFDDVVFSGEGGVFMDITPIEINALEFLPKIVRHLIQDYQAHLCLLLVGRTRGTHETFHDNNFSFSGSC